MSMFRRAGSLYLIYQHAGREVMDWFAEYLHIVVLLDEIAVGIAVVVFAAGVIIAPTAILVRGACWWRRRLKWAAIAMLTSWLGLWLFWRGEARAGRSPSGRMSIRST